MSEIYVNSLRSKLRCAVIGVGYLGAFHIQKYAQLTNVELVAVCDTDPLRLAEIADQHGIPGVENYRDLIGKVDAVSIATPTNSHYAIASDFLSHGVHVLLEKPICQTVEQADHLIQLAKKHSVMFQIGHLERFNPALLALQDEFGEPRFIEAHRLAPFNARGIDVNVILDLMIHDIDIIQSMVKSPIISLDATGAPVLCDSVDIANARIKFASGCIANVTASRTSFKAERKMRIFQPNAYISIDFQNKKYAVYRKNPQEVLRSFDQLQYKNAEFPQSDALLLEITAFVTAILQRTPPVVSGEDGKAALQTAISITNMIHHQLMMYHQLHAEQVV